MTIIQIVGLILLIMVLIKQFKHGGVLQGIIGLITCGFWTFIWGWMKHKPLELTKIMVVWTILIVSPMVLTAVFGFAMMSEMANMLAGMTGEASLTQMKDSFDLKSRKNAAKANIKVNMPNQPKREPQKGDSEAKADWSQKALALWQNGEYTDPNQAVDLWNKAIQDNPNSAESYNNRGLAHYNLKKYPQAVEDYSRAIQLKPDYVVAYNNRGNAYYELTQYDLAEADFNQSIGFEPGYAKAYLNRALTNYQLDRNSQACLDFKKACELGECEGQQWAVQNSICQ
jgi:Flp pilus assembly protein TadD